MVTIKTPEELDRMRRAGSLLHSVLEALRKRIAPGVTTLELDEEAERMIVSAGATPSFKGYNGYRFTLCTSVDDEVVHGFPRKEPLRQGQIVSVDAGLILDGWQSDSAFTAPVGAADPALERLMRVTEECFWLGAAQAVEGNRISDIARAVQTHAEENGYSVIRDMCGHGIGREMHEDPSVPNFVGGSKGTRLRAGMTLAIEPMIALGRWPIYFSDNGWTVITRDHSACSHYEHTVAVTTDRPEILSLPGGRKA